MSSPPAPRIYAPVVGGSGVAVLHQTLAGHLPGYQVHALRPEFGLLPPAGLLLPAPAAPIAHSHPDLGPWVAHRDSQLVTTFHGYNLDAPHLALVSPAQRLFYRTLQRHAVRHSLARARVVTAVSAFTAGLVQQDWNLGKRLLVLRNGVDTRRFAPGPAPEHDGVHILFSGNPSRNKGFADVLALSAELPPGAVIHYTRGMRASARVDLPDTAALAGIERVAHADMPDLYRRHDLLLLPTIREGLSLAVLEAMACGLPVVATRCASLPEQIDHGKGGFLFERGNRREMLDYLRRLAASPALRADMGAYNREKVLREFTLEGMLDGYRAVFDSLGA